VQIVRKIVKRGPGRPGGLGKDRPNGALSLLREGQSAFARHGFDGASLRAISAAAGVDPALAAHHFGSKEALWEAVIDRLTLYLAPYIAELRALQKQKQIPIRVRTETAFRQLISAVCGEPESGMLLSRISTEKGEKLDLLVEKLVRPYHDAFEPLLLDAMRDGLIAEQPIEMLYFMLLYAVAMSVSFRYVLGYFGESYDDLERLKRDMTECVLATFFKQHSAKVAGFAQAPFNDCDSLEPHMKTPIAAESASALIDQKINALTDWRGQTLAKVRAIIHAADPEIIEEWKWVKPTSPGTPVFSRNGIVCTGETYKAVVKMTFAKGAALPDPTGLFNASLEGNVRRAIDIHEGDKINEAALKNLIRAAVALNLKAKPKSPRASTKRAG
jgi:TetR/AcrR family transcriptional regulator